MEGFVIFILILMVLTLLFVAFDHKNTIKKLNIEIENKNNLLNEEVKKVKDNFSKLEEENIELNEKIAELDEEKLKLSNEITKLNDNIDSLTSDIPIDAAVMLVDESITSEEYKSKYNLLTVKERDFVKSENAIKIIGTHDTKESKKLINNDIKQLLRCFNSEVSSILLAITVKNIDSSKNKIIRSFENLNKLFLMDNISMSDELLKMKLEQADLIYAYQFQKEQERLQQKAIREQMIEEEKVRREIEKEKAKIEKEEKQFKGEIAKLMGYMQKASEVEKQLYIDKIRELEDKLKGLEVDKENVLEREQNTRAGYVYVISNIGSFGDDVYKIGMTRRLEPMDRIKELGSASVPFEFDVHAMIFSEDAPALETILHNTFRKNQVNKVNPRKEFFKVKLDDIEKVVKENFNATVTFTKVAEAAQYRESLRLAETAPEMTNAETPDVTEDSVNIKIRNKLPNKSLIEKIHNIFQNAIPDYTYNQEDTDEFSKIHIYTTQNRKLGIVKIIKSDNSMQFKKIGSTYFDVNTIDDIKNYIE